MLSLAQQLLAATQLRLAWTDASSWYCTNPPLEGFLQEVGLSMVMVEKDKWDPYCFPQIEDRKSFADFDYTIVRTRPCTWPGQSRAIDQGCGATLEGHTQGAIDYQDASDAVNAKTIFWWQFMYFTCGDRPYSSEFEAFKDSCRNANSDENCFGVEYKHLYDTEADRIIGYHEAVATAMNEAAAKPALRPIHIPTIVLYKRFIDHFGVVGARAIYPNGSVNASGTDGTIGQWGHQNNLGGYLNACLTFTYVTGIDPRLLSFAQMEGKSGMLPVPQQYAQWVKEECWNLYTTYYTPAAEAQFRTDASPASSPKLQSGSMQRALPATARLYDIRGRLIAQSSDPATAQRPSLQVMVGEQGLRYIVR
jgi:hypothetical protein